MSTLTQSQLKLSVPARAIGLLAVAGAASAAGALFAVRNWHHVSFAYQLMHAKRAAERYYGQCPTVYKDVVVGASPGSRLDVYQPASGSGHPVLIYVYGGSWVSGSKTYYAPIAERLLPEDIVVVVPDYTTYPAAGFPRQTQEIAAAIAWTLDHIGEYGGDPRRVVVCAQSAGAQIAGLALLDPQYLAAHDHRLEEVRGFIGLSGVYDAAAQDDYVRRRWHRSRFVANVMGGPQNLRRASPVSHISPAAPATLLIHGTADTTVPVSMARDFHTGLLAAGISSELVLYSRSGHSSIMFDALRDKPARLITDILRFIRHTTRLDPDGPAAATTAPAERAAAHAAPIATPAMARAT